VKACLFILSGGQGTRLWPLSRKNRPKQFLPLPDGKSLFEKTVERLKLLCSDSIEIGLIAPSCYKSYFEKFTESDIKVVAQEPEPCGTAAAMVLATMKLMQHEGVAAGDDPVVAFFPADHFIGDEVSFKKGVSVAIEYAESNDSIILLGVSPTSAETGYGYIKFDQKDSENVCKVKQFVEKPDKKKAEKLIASGGVCWNSGIYVARASVLLKAVKAEAAQLFYAVDSFVRGDGKYSDVPNISFDYAVAEKVSNLSVVNGEFEWSDVGSLKTFIEFSSAKINKNDVINFKGYGNITNSKKQVVFCGVNDLCLVETEDIVFVVDKNDSESVKLLVKRLDDFTLCEKKL
jgi:mannose-1-phosphate guanylyltransferase